MVLLGARGCTSGAFLCACLARRATADEDRPPSTCVDVVGGRTECAPRPARGPRCCPAAAAMRVLVQSWCPAVVPSRLAPPARTTDVRCPAVGLGRYAVDGVPGYTTYELFVTLDGPCRLMYTWAGSGDTCVGR